jgi:CRISPR-associated protein Cas1
VTEAGKESLYWNIPIANTTSILLGTGTSITQAAVRELAKAGVMLGFCGGGGTPLFAAQEVAWISPQSEYRPTQYLQSWMRFWFDDEKRLAAAKALQLSRLEMIIRCWGKDEAFAYDAARLESLIQQHQAMIPGISSGMDLLLLEARLSKALFAIAAEAVNYGEFTRGQRGDQNDAANQFLDHGNYLAYGLGATATWVLGLPHSVALLHGKTRRGGLVFDAADLVKDAVVLPQAFISAQQGHDEQEFRQHCIQRLTSFEALDHMIDELKRIAVAYGSGE